MASEKLLPDEIRTDGGTQPRVKLSEEVCRDYAERMKDGASFPPIEIYYDGENFWLADGFHRLKAHKTARPEELVECRVHKGTLEDARWHSYGVNKTHGLRRTNEDKSQAVKAALQHPNGVEKSDREISDHVGVSHPFVAKVRGQLESSGNISRCATRTVSRGGKEFQQDTTKIGRSQSPKSRKSRDKSGVRVSRNAHIPKLSYSNPCPMIPLQLSPRNPTTAAATLFQLFERSFLETLIQDLTQRLQGKEASE